MKNKMCLILCWMAVIVSLFIGLTIVMYGLLANVMFMVFCGILDLGVSAYVYERFLDRHKR